MNEIEIETTFVPCFYKKYLFYERKKNLRRLRQFLHLIPVSLCERLTSVHLIDLGIHILYIHFKRDVAFNYYKCFFQTVDSQKSRFLVNQQRVEERYTYKELVPNISNLRPISSENVKWIIENFKRFLITPESFNFFQSTL